MLYRSCRFWFSAGFVLSIFSGELPMLNASLLRPIYGVIRPLLWSCMFVYSHISGSISDVKRCFIPGNRGFSFINMVVIALSTVGGAYCCLLYSTLLWLRSLSCLAQPFLLSHSMELWITVEERMIVLQSNLRKKQEKLLAHPNKREFKSA